MKQRRREKNHMSKCKSEQIAYDECKKSKSYVAVTRKAKRFYSCNVCKQTFTNRHKLKAHEATHKKNFDCRVCGRYLTTHQRLLTHMYKFHGIGEAKSKVFACDLCERSFETKAGLYYHQHVAHQVGKKYICQHCSKVYYHHGPYRSHLLFAHGQKNIVCEICGSLFFTVSKLNAHINSVHRNAKTWECVQCNVKFITGTAYRQHNLARHFKTKYPCDYCQTEFKSRSSLQSHLREHSIFICKVCKVTFVKEYLYNEHMTGVHHHLDTKVPKRRSGYTRNNRDGKHSTTKEKQPFPNINVNCSGELSRIDDFSDILLQSSYTNNNIQGYGGLESADKLAALNLPESGKLQSFSLLSSENELEITSNENIVTIGDSFINVDILNNIEISGDASQLNSLNTVVSNDDLSTNVDVTELNCGITTTLGKQMGNLTSTESDVIQLESVDVTGLLVSAELVNSNVASSVDNVENTTDTKFCGANGREGTISEW